MTPDTEARPDEPRTEAFTEDELSGIRYSTRDGRGNGGGEAGWNRRWLATLDARDSEVRAELRERVAGLRKSQLKPGDTNSWTESYRMGWNALLDAVLALLSESQP